MYAFKKQTYIDINISQASKDIGISRPYLSNILNHNVVCSKVMAYCITKYINKDYEIEDLFDKKGE